MGAILRLNTLDRERLHNLERPTAYISWQTAELNRDRKKQRKPFKPEDYYFYADREKQNLPDARYGAAALELIRLGSFPTWALFVYTDLKSRAADALPPELLCFQCDDAILLAPSTDGEHVSGMLIATISASGERRKMTSPCGRTIDVRMPTLSSKFQAFEDADLRLLR